MEEITRFPSREPPSMDRLNLFMSLDFTVRSLFGGPQLASKPHNYLHQTSETSESSIPFTSFHSIHTFHSLTPPNPRQDIPSASTTSGISAAVDAFASKTSAESSRRRRGRCPKASVKTRPVHGYRAARFADAGQGGLGDHTWRIFQSDGVSGS